MNSTKGEWKITQFGIQDTDGKQIAAVTPRTPHWNAKYDIEGTANTQLIAAAPDMYEALLLAKGTLEALHIRPDDPRYLQIKQALNKAEGK
jgi:hypothetical protein